jgi:hypothetical protein
MHLKENAMAHSFGHAVLVVVYVSIVAWVMQHAQAWFGPAKTVFAPTAFLMLFVLSAVVVGSVVLGRPVLLYAEGQKKEALKFFGFTVLWLFALTIVAFLVLVARR